MIGRLKRSEIERNAAFGFGPTTREGNPVRLHKVCAPVKGSPFCVVGEVFQHGKWEREEWRKNGAWHRFHNGFGADLVPLTPTRNTKDAGQ